MKHLPNFITSMNLASGFTAIIFILTGNITAASWCILAAMAFDFMDGFVARALKAYSELGRELDSLADLVSFGVAPGLMIFRLLVSAGAGGDKELFAFHDHVSIIYLAGAVIMPVSAALRLAIFNLDTTQSTNFKGLPTPANALAVITLVLSRHFSGSSFPGSLTDSPVFLLALSAFLSVMMVTRIPLLSLKFKDLKLKGNEGRYITIALCAVMVAVFGMNGLPGILPVYIIVSVIYFLF